MDKKQALDYLWRKALRTGDPKVEEQWKQVGCQVIQNWDSKPEVELHRLEDFLNQTFHFGV